MKNLVTVALLTTLIVMLLGSTRTTAIGRHLQAAEMVTSFGGGGQDPVSPMIGGCCDLNPACNFSHYTNPCDDPWRSDDPENNCATQDISQNNRLQCTSTSGGTPPPVCTNGNGTNVCLQEQNCIYDSDSMMCINGGMPVDAGTNTNSCSIVAGDDSICP